MAINQPPNSRDAVLDYEGYEHNSNFNAVGIGHADYRLSGITAMQAVNEAESQRRQHFNQLHRVHDVMVHGDTLVYIDYPAPPTVNKLPIDCYGIPFASQNFRVHSVKLLATGSTVFAEMLNPTYQFRVQRRRQLVNKLPTGIKYVLDLSPPSEGDDLVSQMMEVSLTPGIIKWWMSYKLHGTDQALVKGHDDTCSCFLTDSPNKDLHSSFAGDIVGLKLERKQGSQEEVAEVPVSPDQLLLTKPVKQLYALPAHYHIDDYCPIRHRNCIIRVLMTIEGASLALNSASTMWTVLGAAKILDAVPAVRSTILAWILSNENTKFIEALPEEALKIGFAVESHLVTQNAYRILVNELALQEASHSTVVASCTHKTVFGRIKGDAGDELDNLVQHGARKLQDRITRQWSALNDAQLLDTWSLPEWQRLCNMENILEKEEGFIFQEALTAVRALMETLKLIVPSTFKEFTAPSSMPFYESYAGIDRDRVTIVDTRTFEPLQDIMERLNPIQRMLTPFIYHKLRARLTSGLLYNSPSFSKIGRQIRRLEEALTRLRTLEDTDFKKETWELLGSGILVYNSNKSHWEWFNWKDFQHQAEAELSPLAASWLRHNIQPPLNITRHLLLTLNSEEMKYLPLWADGCNDGTGGVFQDFLPPTDMGPNGPGPSYHTGQTIPSDSSSLSETFVDDLLDLDIRGTNTMASMGVQDSISTVYRPDEIIVDDESIAPSDSLSVTEDDDVEFNEARAAIPPPPTRDEAVTRDEEAAVSPPPTRNEAAENFDDMFLYSSSDDDSMSTITDNDTWSDI